MIYYRVSDNSYPKVKLPGATKVACWLNFRKAFPQPVTLVLDNCRDETLSTFRHVTTHVTSLGNAGSLSFVLGLTSQLPPDEVVYFVEDDYLHRHDCQLMDLIAEGLTVADYVTLYDHPDKYSSDYGGGETCRVFRTRSSHWRTTISTCMTFATTAKTVLEDREVWEKWLTGSHPHDHQIFTDLSRDGRSLTACIPGQAVHVDPTWGGMDAIEPWAVSMMFADAVLAVTMSADPQVHAYKDRILGMDVKTIDKLKMLCGLLQ
jgi:hypothetical protein